MAPLGDRIVACYGLKGRRRSILFDTCIEPAVEQHVVPGLTAAGIPPERLDWVIISHSDLDHSGGNAAIRRVAPRAQLCCHALDYPLIADVETLIAQRYRCYAADHGIDESAESLAWLRANVRHTSIDTQLRGGEVFALDDDFEVEVLHVPGHSRGHIALFDRRRHVLLGQDCVLGSAVPTRDGPPAFPPTYRYVDDYLATIGRLEALQLDALLTAHYRPLMNREDVAAFLAESREFVEATEAALRNALSQAAAPLTMRQIIAKIGRRLGRWPETADEFLVWPLTGHLERLEADGLVRRARRDGVATYTFNPN